MIKGNNDIIMVGWTTVTSQKDARNMVHNLLESKLIACGEIEGPFSTIYRWNEKNVEDDEWRVCLKFPKSLKSKIKKRVSEIHPYELPQWIYWEVETSEEYKTWVCTNTSP
jgi:periplasmic divalent cation tolerance protein